jgi:hypothetical protein
VDPIPAVEQQIARHMVRHAVVVAPVVVVLLGVLRSGAAAASGALGLALVVANFLLAAALQGWSARISPATVVGTVMAGYVVRLGVLVGAVLALRQIGWVDVSVLVLTVAAAHLALLVWELRSVRLSFAEPGLRTVQPSVPARKE